MLRAWLVYLFMVLTLGFGAFSNAEPLSVGRIALSVGEAKRVDMTGRSAPLRLGASIAEGDRIITGGDAVAIIVFTDDARVSLRADSEMVVRQYKVDPAGINSRLELELVRGSIRQISGRAADMQPERYRLNTPIAAVGVRGTDFLAKVSVDVLETFVQEGKIVVLSNHAACAELAQTGGCAPLAGMSANDTARYLRVLTDGKIERRVVAPDEVERLFGIRLVKSGSVATVPVALVAPSTTAIAKPAEPSKAADESVKPVVVVEAVPRDLPIASDKVRTVLPAALTDLLSPTLGFIVSSEPVAELPPSPEAGSAVPTVTHMPDLSRQLVWGRFSSADQLPLQQLAPYETASKGRTVTVGDPGQFALWRTGSTQEIEPALRGAVEFAMRSGEAYLQQGSQLSNASITSPSLSIDFDRAVFSSRLTLSHPQTGGVALSASGSIDGEGRFLAVGSGQRVAGAVSLNGAEAGYWFSKEHGLGVFKGVTLWNAR